VREQEQPEFDGNATRDEVQEPAVRVGIGAASRDGCRDVTVHARKQPATRAGAGDVVPNKSAIVAHWGNADAAGALLFSRDIAVLDGAEDDGADASGFVRELLCRQRRVFVLEDGFPQETLHQFIDKLRVVTLTTSPFRLVEVSQRQE
jgi:hypothetical protein